MKNVMKKLMSMILTLALVVGMIGIVPIKAEAEDTASYPVWDMQEPYEVITTESEQWIEVSVTAAEDGLYKIYSTNTTETDPRVEVVLPDESSKNYDDANGWDFSLILEMKAGEEFLFRFGNCHDSGSYLVHCEKMVPSGVSIAPNTQELTMFENSYGYTDVDANGNEYFYYDTSSIHELIYIQIEYSDSTEVYSISNLQEMGFYVEITDNQDEIHWAVGEECLLRIDVLGEEVTVPVTIREMPFESFEVTKNPTAKYVIGDGTYVWTDDSGEAYFFNPMILSGMEIEAFYADGTTGTYTYKELVEAVGEDNIGVESHTIPGPGTYDGTVFVLGMSATYSAEVVAEPIAKEIIVGETYTVTDECGYEWFKITANADGDYRFYVSYFGEENHYVEINIFDGNLNHLAGIEDEVIDGYDFGTTLYRGETYYIRTSTKGLNEGFTLAVMEEKRPSNIEVLGGKIQTVAGANGDYMSDAEGSYYYYHADALLSDRTIRVTYTDGTYIEFFYGEEPENLGLNMYTNQDETRWTVGSENYIYMEIGDLEIEIPVEIVMPKTTSINQDTAYTYNSDEMVYYSFVPAKSGMYRFYSFDANDADPYVWLYDSSFNVIEYMDDAEGLDFVIAKELEAGQTYYYGVDAHGDETCSFKTKLTRQKQATNLRIVSGGIEVIENVDGGMWGEDEVEYFRYNYEGLWNMVFEVTLDDGTKHQLQIFEMLEGITLDYIDDQAENPWGIEKENFLTVVWLNKSVKVPVTIVENPVIGISFVNVTEMPEYILGDLNYMWPDGDAAYTLYAHKWEGYQLKVEYRDGTNQTYTLDKEGEINGYYLDIQELMVSEVGEYTVTYKYMANECTLPIRVVESSIASIEVVKDPTINEIPRYVVPNFAGMEIKVTYTDGTAKNITVTEDMIDFSSENAYFNIEAEDVQILCRSDYDGEKEKWILHLLGREYIYEGIKSKDIVPVDLEASNITVTGAGMKLQVTFSDGTKKDYVVDPFFIEKHGDYYTGYMRADGGFVSYSVYVGNAHPDGTPCSGGVNAFALGTSIDEMHEMTFVPAKAATCTTAGNIAYYKCSCGQLFADENGTRSITSAQTKVAKHTIKYVKAVKATSKKNGNKAHYACSCGKLYLDAACKKQVSKGDVTLAVVDKTSISKVTGKKKALTVKWKKKSGVTGYEVQVALKKNFKKGLKTTTVKGAKKVSATVKSLKAKKTYYVRIRAYKIVNGATFYSGWSKVVKKKTK